MFIMDHTTNSRIQPPSTRMLVLQTEYEVRVVECSSSTEKCYGVSTSGLWLLNHHLEKARSKLKLSNVATNPLSFTSLPPNRTFLQANTRSGCANITFIELLLQKHITFSFHNPDRQHLQNKKHVWFSHLWIYGDVEMITSMTKNWQPVNRSQSSCVSSKSNRLHTAIFRVSFFFFVNSKRIPQIPLKWWLILPKSSWTSASLYICN